MQSFHRDLAQDFSFVLQIPSLLDKTVTTALLKCIRRVSLAAEQTTQANKKDGEGVCSPQSLEQQNWLLASVRCLGIVTQSFALKDQQEGVQEFLETWAEICRSPTASGKTS